jgi:hypothetical protein
MDEAAVLRRLKEIHRDIEIDAGKDPDCVMDDVQPFDGLAGFDSLLFPNVVRELAGDMGIPIPKGVRLRNPYVGPNRKQKLTLRDVAKRFCELYGKEAQPS